ncbi:MAG: hypothetical protein R2697_06390 [Ilumatobacteraceae bacterium]
MRDAYDLLRQQGLDPAAALDTNFYTELHEGAVTPSNAAERMAISADQTVVSLMEVELSAPGSLGDLRQAQLDALARTEMPDSVRGEMRQRIEQQFATAERRAAEISAGGREAALQRARARLEDALQRTPPPSARELRQLMADVKLLEPDAYGSRAAVEGVVHGQQGLRRAETTADRAAAGRHVGPVGRGEGTLTERLEHRLQQARASLGHLLAHVRPPGRNSVRDVLAVAKQLARILHAFREAGQFIDHPLLDDAGAVVASKSENDPDATIREVRVWAERAGLRFGSEQALLDAYVAEARRLGIEMTTRLGTSTESARSFEGPPTDAPPPDAAPSTPDASAPTMSERPAEMSADRPASRSDVDAVDGDGAAAAARSDGPPLRPHEVAHEQLLDRLRASMDRPIPTPDGPTRPIAAGEVGRARDPNRAYDMFRDAVARAGGREVGLFFERASGTYAVVVGREASVSPPRGNGVWECPIHTHPNPENVLVYRMPAPNDVLQYWQTAMRTGRRASAFIEYPLPEGGRGTCRLEIDPNGDITFEYRGQDAPETLSIGEYQERWDSRTRYVEPGTPQYERFLRDMEDRARDRDRYSGDAALPDDPLAYGFEFRTDDLRSRIDAAPDHPDAPELLGLLEEAEVYREMGEEADAAAMLDEVERRVRLIEPEWRPAAGETEPETGAPTADRPCIDRDRRTAPGLDRVRRSARRSPDGVAAARRRHTGQRRHRGVARCAPRHRRPPREHAPIGGDGADPRRPPWRDGSARRGTRGSQSTGATTVGDEDERSSPGQVRPARITDRPAPPFTQRTRRPQPRRGGRSHRTPDRAAQRGPDDDGGSRASRDADGRHHRRRAGPVRRRVRRPPKPGGGARPRRRRRRHRPARPGDACRCPGLLP